MGLPTIWPGWETVREIGSGGFGKVYEIQKEDSSGEYRSALKVISIPQSEDEYRAYEDDGYDEESITAIFKSQIEDVVKEFQVMAQFKGNSNIVSYEDHMTVPHDDGKGWDILIRMELLTSLPDHFKRQTIKDEDVIRLGMDICSALDLCANRGIIHRDVKPQNIFINDFGNYKLGDFGIAKTMDHTTRATKVGTYTYMAPEVYNGQPYNATADVYSLALVMYWLLNERRLPFIPLPPAIPTASQNDDARARRLSGDAIPAPKNGSPELKMLILKALQYNPKNRFSSAKEMKAALLKLPQNKNEEPSMQEIKDPPIQMWFTCPNCGRRNELEGTEKNPPVFTHCARCGWDENDETEELGTAVEEDQHKIKEDEQGLSTPEMDDEGATIIEDSAVNGGGLVSNSDYYKEPQGHSAEWGRMLLATAVTLVVLIVLIAAFKGCSQTGSGESGESVLSEEGSYGLSDSIDAPGADLMADSDQDSTNEIETVGYVETNIKKHEIIDSFGDRIAYIDNEGCGVLAEFGSDETELIPGWTDLVSIAVGPTHVVGLKADRTVVVESEEDNFWGECNVGGWTDIISIETGVDTTIGVRADGTVLIAGRQEEEWETLKGVNSIEKVVEYYGDLIAIKRDGTIEVLYDEESAGIAFDRIDVSSLTNIVDISCGSNSIFALSENGKVTALGVDFRGENNVQGWSNIQKVCAGGFWTIGIKEDGTVIAVGENDSGQCNISNWESIKGITTISSAYTSGTAGLMQNGELIYTSLVEEPNETTGDSSIETSDEEATAPTIVSEEQNKSTEYSIEEVADRVWEKYWIEDEGWNYVGFYLNDSGSIGGYIVTTSEGGRQISYADGEVLMSNSEVYVRQDIGAPFSNAPVSSIKFLWQESENSQKPECDVVFYENDDAVTIEVNKQNEEQYYLERADSPDFYIDIHDRSTSLIQSIQQIIAE